MDVAKDFAYKAACLGMEVIAASSVSHDRSSLSHVNELIYLPYVTDDVFDQQFYDAIRKFQITHVFTPHAAVWIHLNQLCNTAGIDHCFHLCEPEPFTMDWQPYSTSYYWAQTILTENFIDGIGTCGQAQNKLSLAEYAGLHKQFTQVPGQCDEEKLYALTEIMRITEPGDIVEVGSLYGRSAYALGYLADKYGLGTVISVDPWQYESLDKQGDKAELLNQQLVTINSDRVFNIFQANISLLNNVTYIRDFSIPAANLYRSVSHSGECIQINQRKYPITGEISLLHIDGNHHYDAVSDDLEHWLPMVRSKGWVLVDDYVWAFGDGPQRAGDDCLQSNLFDIAFCMSDTLFLRKR